RVVHIRICRRKWPGRRLIVLEHAVVRRLVDLHGLPWTEAVFRLLGILRRIARGAERLGAEPRGRLMVLSAAGAIRPHRHEHVGPRESNQADVVTDDLALAPLVERLVDAEREAEIDGSREELLRPIVVMCR